MAHHHRYRRQNTVGDYKALRANFLYRFPGEEIHIGMIHRIVPRGATPQQMEIIIQSLKNEMKRMTRGAKIIPPGPQARI